MTDRPRSRSTRTAIVWEILRDVLDETAKESGRDRLDVVDAGGGTGGFAVPLAELGHRVTVVDASPDALAGLERRAAEAGVAVRAAQGDADGLLDVVGPDSADLVICHSVLEYVDDPATALAAIARTVRPGGAVSVLAANQVAAVLHRALAGHFEDARRVLSSAQGRWGDRDPVPRRFTSGMLAELIDAAGLRSGPVHGVRVFADLVPSGIIDGERGAADELVALERAVSMHPVLKDVATQLHALAYRR
ncbi:methyltransferase domain-containing protein [Actinoallomurus rhizosphaericola]|uniref:methyltransferase domain-containing protein n=1 Tax=Actinoallomurus rhizosphaericola TaxID=2952536 RepID=UPI002093973D|nr:methyltransferase domain-containing protein [Actinoallomurus rhizosphaericola]MCO5996637.1 methyltransferase domain-containing protein [Actinoallomurus rhizosphaericola]